MRPRCRSAAGPSPREGFSCEFSLPVRPATLVPRSFLNCLALAIRSSGWLAPESAVAALTAAGAEVRRGDLDDLEGLAAAAAAADGVIHLAFKHEAMRSRGLLECNRQRPRRDRNDRGRVAGFRQTLCEHLRDAAADFRGLHGPPRHWRRTWSRTGPASTPRTPQSHSRRRGCAPRPSGFRRLSTARSIITDSDRR